jgi:hypothetical protein
MLTAKEVEIWGMGVDALRGLRQCNLLRTVMCFMYFAVPYVSQPGSFPVLHRLVVFFHMNLRGIPLR